MSFDFASATGLSSSKIMSHTFWDKFFWGVEISNSILDDDLAREFDDAICM